MFLDDQLYEWVKFREIEKPDDFQTLVNELYRITEDYIKSKLSFTMTYAEGTAMLNKAFKLWDMFIAKLEKENWFLIDILKDYPYKKMYLSNPKLKEIYDKGL